MSRARQSRKIMVGNVPVGGGAPVSIQSMCNTDTRNAARTLAQINELAKLGCEIIRVAVPDAAAAEALKEICSASPIPVIADIHFDHRLALAAMDAGIAAVRINPGNIGSEENIRLVAKRAGEANIPIRVGANSGSLKKELLEELVAGGMNMEEAICEGLVASALEQCAILEKYNFTQIKVSLKASSVVTMVNASRLFAARTDYPLHIGVTEAGTPARGIVKSSIGIGALLLDGIGDTIRVSLTADPKEEVLAGRRILESCELRDASPELVSCPTCGRTEIDLIGLANKVESLVNEIKSSGKVINLKKIAVMGCIVNGPGEARDADLGVAGGKGKLAVFRFGKIAGTFSEEEGFAFLRDEIMRSVTTQE